MQHPKTRAFALLAIVGTQIGSHASAGGIERFCSGLINTMVTERWASSNGIAWEVCGGPGTNPSPSAPGDYLAPGYPPLTSPLVQALTPSQRPMTQSIFRAIAAWNTAGLSTAVPRVANFTFSTPTIVPNHRAIQDFINQPPEEMGFVPKAWWNTLNQPGGRADNINTITMWDGPSTFATMGGPQVLAATGVRPGALGAIAEVDIAINARMGPATTGPRYWSFVEENASLGVTLATRTDFNPNTPTFTDPVFGYVDLEGLLVHEFGHFAGLGHTLVDATNLGSVSTFPTMFSEAQNEPFATTVSTLTLNGWVTAPADASVTAVKGILGRSGRTLETDDLFAIAEGYPLTASNPYWQQTGQLAGTIVTSTGVAQPGVAVTAVSATQPDLVRVGTVSLAGGSYRITGLPPGSYYVKIETVDRGYFGAYFQELDVPNFVQTPFNGGCLNQLPFFGTEWFNSTGGSDEPLTETSNTTATPVTVTAGLTTTANLRMNTQPNNLRVRQVLPPTTPPSPQPFASGRGVRARVGDNLLFVADGMPAGTVAVLVLDVAHTMIPFGTDLIEVNPVNPVVSLTAIADATGTANFASTVPATAARANFFAQVGYVNATGGISFTNSVNVWVAQP